MAPATSTLNVGEVDSLFTEVPGRIGFLRTSPSRSSRKFAARENAFQALAATLS
jgi:hypothetical protein